MKFTLSWLKDHLETEAPLDAIVEKLTAIGLEVEEVSDRAAALRDFTVARVIEAVKHPNADKLKLCTVETGGGTYQVVCGAPNARAGMKGVFAPVGTTIPGTGTVLKAATIRGVESHGMLCSEREMGLSDEHEGIIELPDDAPVGAPFAQVLGLDDPVIEIAITPNRQDCLGVRGIARDLAAAGMGVLKPKPSKPVTGAYPSPVGIVLDFPEEAADACSLFAGRVIRGVNNGPSPRWLQQRLLAIGLRPISALVDITNFFTIDRARPLHVYDVAKLSGDIRARLGRTGERFVALDGKEYEVDEEACVIADDARVLGFGGVIGGEYSGCTEATTEVFLEAAYFDPVRTARTGRRMGIESDARYRFERGIDPEYTVPGLEDATRMILELCGGEPSEPVVVGSGPDWRRMIELRPERVASLGGIEVPARDCTRILEDLGFGVEEFETVLQVEVPSWRCDIDGEADLVEEITRIAGYERIPATPLMRPEPVARPVLTTIQRRVRRARRCLAARGASEAVTWSFTASPYADLFGGAAPELRLVNPISSELDAMRPSLLPNLLLAAGRNQDRGLADAALFEIGPQYADDTPEGQNTMATGVRWGRNRRRHWAGKPRPVDAFDAKADALAVLEVCGLAPERVQITADAPAWYHPGRAGTLWLGPKTALAHFGEIHPGVLDDMGLKGPIVGFEVYLDRLPQPRRARTTNRPPVDLPDLPSVGRDFAFLVDRDVPAQAIVDAARKADRNLIIGAHVFDVFEGESLGEGKKSVAISVTLQPREKTLTEAEITTVAKRIVAAVEKATGGRLRG